MTPIGDGDESTLSAEEAFTILGNETRMEILLTLWEAYEPDAEVNDVTFTELRDRVGIRRGGKFHYHLDKLLGHYVRKTDHGYELRHTGRILVQTVISGTSIEDPVVEPTEVEEGADALASATGSYATCLHCGAPTAVTYQDGTLFLVCTDCEGHRERSELDVSGVLVSGSLDPAGLTNRTLEGATNAHLIRMRDTMLSAIEGVCHRCNSPMDTSLRVCDDHSPDGGCNNCEQMAAITAESRCRVCKTAPHAPPYWRAVMHPAVIGFFYERGKPLLYTRDAVHPPEDAEQELVSDDPPRVRIAYECAGDRLELLVDEELNVLEITESD